MKNFGHNKFNNPSKAKHAEADISENVNLSNSPGAKGSIFTTQDSRNQILKVKNVFTVKRKFHSKTSTLNASVSLCVHLYSEWECLMQYEDTASVLKLGCHGIQTHHLEN